MPCVIAGVFRRIGQLLKHNIYPHQHQKVGLILHVYTYLWFQVIAIWDRQKTWTAWWPKHLMPMVLTGHNLVPCRLSIYAWLWMELVLKKSSIMSFNHIIIVIQLPQCHNSDKGHMLHWCIYAPINIMPHYPLYGQGWGWQGIWLFLKTNAPLRGQYFRVKMLV